jgi:hypothetical protein
LERTGAPAGAADFPKTPRMPVVRYLKWVLGRLWFGWKKFAYGLGVVNRYVLLTLFYWLIVNVTNLGVRLLRVDLLNRRMRPAESYWNVRHDKSSTYEHQF